MVNEDNLIQILAVSLLWLFTYLFFYKKRGIYNNSLIAGLSLWGATTLFCIFYSYGYDFFSYERRFNAYLLLKNKEYLENLYFILIDFSFKNYTIWRLFVWGGATLFVILTIKRLKIPFYFFSLIFLSLPLIHSYYYLRNSLGFALFFWGFSLFITRKSYFDYMLGALGVICSIFLHKSMPLYLFVALLCYIIPFNKKTIKTSFILFPILYILTSYFTYTFLNLSIFNDAAIRERGIEYIDSSYSQNLTVFGYLQMIIIRFPVLLALYHCMKRKYFSKCIKTNEMDFYLKFSYVMIYISLLFIGQGMSEHISLRFWNAALLPLCIFLSSYLFFYSKKTFTNIILRLTFFSTIYVLLYNIYTFYK